MAKKKVSDYTVKFLWNPQGIHLKPRYTEIGQKKYITLVCETRNSQNYLGYSYDVYTYRLVDRRKEAADILDSLFALPDTLK